MDKRFRENEDSTLMSTTSSKNAGQNATEHNDKDSKTIELVSSSGEIFLVDKDNIISCSDYFQGLFSSGMRESLLNRVELPTIESESIRMILKYVNGKDLYSRLDLNSIKLVLAAANYLQMSDVLKICLTFLESNVTVKECYRMLLLGEELMIAPLVQLMDNFIKSHVETFTQTNDFVHYAPEQVIKLLSCDNLSVDSELSIFTAILHWLEANSPLDKYDCDELSRITHCVRFGLLTDEERQSCIDQARNMPESVKRVVSSGSCFTDYPNRLHRDKSIWYMPRTGSSKLFLVLTGGFTRKSECSTNRVQLMSLDEFESQVPSKSENCYKFFIHSKIRLPEPLCEHCTCVMDNYLYVAGGQRNYCVNGKYTQNTVWRFDPRICQWIKVSSMKKPRSLFCLLPLDGSMYAVCGWLEPDRVNRSVERYDPETDTWSYVAPIVIGLHEHAGCSYKGYLYVSGGYKGPARGHLDQLWKYDPAADSWSQLCPMYQARSYHCMVSLETEDKLLVTGGVCSADELFMDIQNCELYDVSTNQWTMLSSIPLPASCMPCLLHKNKLYLFGGHAFQDGNDKHNSIQVLDLNSWTWDVCSMDASGILCSCLNILSFQNAHFKKH